MKVIITLCLFCIPSVLATNNYIPRVKPNLQKIIKKTSKQYRLPSKLLYSVGIVESGFRYDVVHYNDGGSPSYGIFQLKLETVKRLGFGGSPRELLDPRVNAKYAAKLLRKALDRYDGDVDIALRVYNRGSWDGERDSDYHQKVRMVMSHN